MSNESSGRFANEWQIADLIDFEYLLAADVAARNTESSRADELFRSKVLPALESVGEISRPVVFRSWVDAHREVAEHALPGSQWTAAWHFLSIASAAAGLLIGGSMTGALLLYQGDVPVNVAWFLVCTLGLQILVLFVAAALWLLRRTMGVLNDFRPIRQALSRAVNLGLGKLAGDQRQRLKAVFATMDRRREIYGSVTTWPFLIVTQVFGVGFNLGIVGVLLANVAFKDIEFGWQSSFVQSDEAAFAIASGIATPWKWAPNAHPTLHEVAESHFRYKEKRSNTSWWPFLCYSILFYGLIVRGGFLALAALKLRSSLRQLAFDHEGCPSLYRRLIGPAVRSQGNSQTLEIPAHAIEEGGRARSGEAIALVATDVQLTENCLSDYVCNRYGWNVSEIQKAQIDHPSGNAAVLATVADKSKDFAGIVLIVPAERPPIKAIALFLGKVASAAGPRSEIILLLLGQKISDDFASVEQEHFGYWQNFVAINKLHVSLEKWGDQ